MSWFDNAKAFAKQFMPPIFFHQTPMIQGKPLAEFEQSYQQILEHAPDYIREYWQSAGLPLPAKRPPGDQPRVFQYVPGQNIAILPRGLETVQFQTLKDLAETQPILRGAIEHVKRAVLSSEWDIVPRDPTPDSSLMELCDELKHFFEYPDKKNHWCQWLAMLLEQRLVLDAVTIWPHPNIDGSIHALEIIDGATIKVLLDEKGRIPDPPAPAYQQFLYGTPYTQFTQEDVIIFPQFRRPDRLYGYSEVEKTILTVNMLLRRDIWNLAYFTDGNAPAGVLKVPKEWSLQQIQQYQDYWDAMLAGNLQLRRRLRFVPEVRGEAFQAFQNAELFAEFDEWFARIISWHFGISPTPLFKEVNRATAQEQADFEAEEGIGAVKLYVEALINHILHNHMRIEDVRFNWITSRSRQMTRMAQVYVSFVQNKIMTQNEVRQELGLEVFDTQKAPQAPSGQSPITPQSGSTPTPDENLQDRADETIISSARNSELAKFEKKILSKLADGKTIDEIHFESEIIGDEIPLIKMMLKKRGGGQLTRDKVKQVFKEYRDRTLKLSPKRERQTDDAEVQRLKTALTNLAKRRLQEKINGTQGR